MTTMKEDRDQARKDGFALGMGDETYRRNWPCPYVTGSARWAMVAGYEAAWTRKRAKARVQAQTPTETNNGNRHH